MGLPVAAVPVRDHRSGARSGDRLHNGGAGGLIEVRRLDLQPASVRRMNSSYITSLRATGS
jgi:hypothetical protein